MTPEQIMRQLRSTLRTLSWPGTGNRLFGQNGVIVSSGFPEEHIITLPRPCMILNDGGGSAHSQSPMLFTMSVEALIFLENVGEIYGEAVLLGRGRSSLSTTPGSGLLQIENVMIQEFYEKSRVGGINIALLYKSAAKGEKIGNVDLLRRGYIFDIECSHYGGYDLPTAATIGVTGDGPVTITWTLSVGTTTRYDYKRVSIVRKQNSAPANVSDGTLIYQGTALNTTDNPGVGTWYYAAFVEYDEDEDGTTDSYSAGIADSRTIS